MIKKSNIINTCVTSLMLTRQVLSALTRMKTPTICQHAQLTHRYLVFIVRLYKEDKALIRMLSYYLNILSSIDNTFLVLACSKQEQIDNPQHSSSNILYTLLLDNKFNSVRNRIFIYNAPDRPNIAHQCNYAIQSFLDDIQLPPETIWIKTMDVDTVLSEEVINELIYTINTDAPVIEIAADYTKNYGKLNTVQRWHAAYQDFWSVDIEQFHGLLKNKFAALYAPVSGAGSTFRLDIFQRLGGLPENVAAEDLAISTSINQQRISITTLHSRLQSDVPTTFMEGFEQEIRWAEGSIDASLFSLRHYFDTKGSSLAPFIYTIWANFIWASFSPFIAISLIRALKHKRLIMSLPAVILTTSYATHFVHIERRFETKLLPLSIRLLYCPIQMLRISIPWWCAMLRKVSNTSDARITRKSNHE